MTGVELGNGAGPDLVWLAGVLWGTVEEVGVCLGSAPPGRIAVEAYDVVPSAARARVLLPTDRPSAAAALRAGSGLRGSRQRRRRTAVALAVGSGATRLVAHDRLTVHVASGATAGRLLSDEIEEALGRPVALAVNVRPPGPYRKPVVQAVAGGDGVIAYAKVAWNAPTERNVAAEARALRAASVLAAPRTPRVIGERAWGGRPVLLTEPMPERLRRPGPDEAAPGVDVVRRVAGLFGPPAPRDPAVVCSRLRERASALGPSREASALHELLAAMAAAGAAPLLVGAWHGDWAPWNLARGGDELWAWDWEYARDGAPMGLDAIHYAFQTAFVGQRRGLAAAFDHARSTSSTSLTELGVAGEAAELTHAVHHAEIALRFLQAQADGAEPNLRYLAEATPVLRSQADRIRATADAATSSRSTDRPAT